MFIDREPEFFYVPAGDVLRVDGEAYGMISTYS